MPGSVLFVVDTLSGGLEAATFHGARFLSDRGWEVVIAAPGAAARGDLPVTGRSLPIPASIRNLRDDVEAVRAIRHVLHEAEPDVVHCHGLRSFALTRAAGVTPFVTQHGTGGNHDDPPGYARLRRSGLRLIPRLARAAWSAEAIDVPGWVHLAHASPRLGELEPRGFDEAADPEPTALWLGQLARPKRPDLFIHAVAAAHRRSPLRALVAGQGPLQGELEEQAAALGAPVEFLGQRDDVRDLIERAWVVTLLSDYWAGGFAVQEAMWVGRAVITSDLAAHRWLMGPTGRTAASVEAVANHLVDLCARGRAAAAGRANSTRIRSLIRPDDPWPEIASTYESPATGEIALGGRNPAS